MLKVSQVLANRRLAAIAIVGLFVVVGLGVISVPGAVPAANAVFFQLPSISISPNPATPNSAVTIQMSLTLNCNSCGIDGLYGPVVFTPSGAAYVGSVSFISGSGTLSCNIPFGAAGTESGTQCSGSNSVAWTPITGTVPSLATFEADCTSLGQPPPFTTGTAGVGSTSQTGTYTVLICSAEPGPYTTSTFTIQAPASGVPQFPVAALSPLLLVALLLPALLVMNRKFRARPAL